MKEWITRPDFVAQYASAQFFLLLARALPLESALRLGALGGRYMMRWTRRNIGVAEENLRHAFPEMTERARRDMVQRVYEHFGRAAVEMAVADRLLRPSTIERHITLHGEHVLRRVLEESRGAIFVTAHLGMWELFSFLMRRHGVTPVSVYRAIKNPFLDRMVRRRRTHFGQEMIERDGALMPLLRVLRRGGYIAMVADQHAKRDGVWVPFFGRVASVTPGPALLALRTGAPIVTGCLVRAPGTYRFEAWIDEPIVARPGPDREADIRDITVEVTRRIEDYVRRYPDQWLWLHRRWRMPPWERDKRKANVTTADAGA